VNSRTFVYKSAGSCDIHVDIFWEDDKDLPDAFPGNGLPIIFWIHGGGLISGCRTDIRADQKFLYVAAGFAVISVDYRLAPETRLPEIIEDLRDAFRWVREDLPTQLPVPIDLQRVAVVGHSAGGYLTLMSGFCILPPPKVLVAFYGYGDITAPWYSSPDPFYCNLPRVPKKKAYQSVGRTPIACATGNNNRGDFYLYCRQNGLWPKEVSGFDPLTENSAFNPYCPLRNVTETYPPTMLLHGMADTDVPVAQSQQMADALEKAGVPTQLVLIPDGSHGFDGRGMFDPSVGSCFNKVMDFIFQFLD